MRTDPRKFRSMTLAAADGRGGYVSLPEDVRIVMDKALFLAEIMGSSKVGAWEAPFAEFLEAHLPDLQDMVNRAKISPEAMWAFLVKDRDGWKCRLCGTHHHLESHHIIPRSECHKIDPALILDPGNGLTLCHREHMEIQNNWRDHLDKFQALAKDRPFPDGVMNWILS